MSHAQHAAAKVGPVMDHVTEGVLPRDASPASAGVSVGIRSGSGHQRPGVLENTKLGWFGE